MSIDRLSVKEHPRKRRRPILPENSEADTRNTLIHTQRHTKHQYNDSEQMFRTLRHQRVRVVDNYNKLSSLEGFTHDNDSFWSDSSPSSPKSRPLPKQATRNFSAIHSRTMSHPSLTTSHQSLAQFKTTSHPSLSQLSSLSNRRNYHHKQKKRSSLTTWLIIATLLLLIFVIYQVYNRFDALALVMNKVFGEA